MSKSAFKKWNKGSVPFYIEFTPPGPGGFSGSFSCDGSGINWGVGKTLGVQARIQIDTCSVEVIGCQHTPCECLWKMQKFLIIFSFL